MEHQDTKLTSMRPRQKELNDNPYLIEIVKYKQIQLYFISVQKAVLYLEFTFVFLVCTFGVLVCTFGDLVCTFGDLVCTRCVLNCLPVLFFITLQRNRTS